MGLGEIFSLEILLSLRDQASAGLRGFTHELENSHTAAYKNVSVFGAMNTIMMRGIETARQIGGVWKHEAESLDKYTEAAERLMRARFKFQSIGLRPEENQQAFAAVAKTVNTLPGVTLTDTTETVTDLHTAIGNLHEAIAALPMATKFRIGMETMHGDKYSHEQLETQIQNAFKFLEMIGAVRATGDLDPHTGKREFSEADRSKMEEYFSRQTQIMASTGGRVTPSEMLQMAKTGGTALQGMSIAGLTHLEMPMQEMGGSRTGTALQTLFQQVVGGRMVPRFLPEWERMGLLRRKDEQGNSLVEVTKAGIVSKMRPGAIPIGELAQKDPLEFADRLGEAMSKHGINTQDQLAVAKGLAGLGLNRTAAELTSLLISQRDRVVKAETITTGATGHEALFQQAKDSPLFAKVRYEAAMENFRAQVGMPLLEMAPKLFAAFQPFIQMMTDHPKWTLGLILFKSAGVGVIETIFLLRASGLLSWLGSASTAAETAAETTGVLGGRLRALPSVIKISLLLTAVGLTIEQIMKLKALVEEKEAGEKHLNELAKEGDRGTDQMIQSFRDTGQPVPKEQYRRLASFDVSVLNKDKELEYAFAPERQPWYSRVFGPTNMFRNVPQDLYGSVVSEGRKPGTEMRKRVEADPNYSSFWGDSKAIQHILLLETAARHFRQRAPDLKNPAVMGEFLTQTSKFNLPEQGKADLRKSLEIAFPESYRQAQSQLEQSTKALEQPTSAVADNMTRLSYSLMPLPTSVDMAVASLEALGRRFQTYQPGMGAGAAAADLMPKTRFMDTTPVLPAKAAGGRVRRTGLVTVHAGEDIVPASVTAAYERRGRFGDEGVHVDSAVAARSLAARSRSQRPINVNVTLSPHIVAHGEIDFDQKLREYAHTVGEVIDDRLNRLMERV
jgi:hypothetical protein